MRIYYINFKSKIFFSILYVWALTARWSLISLLLSGAYARFLYDQRQDKYIKRAVNYITFHICCRASFSMQLNKILHNTFAILKSSIGASGLDHHLATLWNGFVLIFSVQLRISLYREGKMNVIAARISGRQNPWQIAFSEKRRKCLCFRCG